MMKLWNIILLSIITLLSTVIDNVTAFRCPRVCVCTSHVISSDEVLKIDCHGRKLSVDILQKTTEMEPVSSGKVQHRRPPMSGSSQVARLDMSRIRLPKGDATIQSGYLQPFAELYLENVTMCCSNLSLVADDAFKYAGEVGFLDLSRNLLKEITFVRNLTSLRQLNLEDNKLMMISVLDVRSLDDLEVLRLGGNRLVSVSFLIMTLPQLVVLDVSDNSLKMIAPKSFNEKPNLKIIDVSENKIKIVNFCLMLPLTNDTGQLELVDLSVNPMYCGCHLMWIYHTEGTVIPSRCVQPDTWETTADVTKHCSLRTVPTCSTGNPDDELPWDPYATLPTGGPEAGAAGGTSESTDIKPKKHSEAAAVQISLIALVAVVAVGVALGAAVRNQRNNYKNEKSTNGGAETKEIKGDAIDAYRLSVARAEEDTFKMDEMNRTERNGPRVKGRGEMRNPQLREGDGAQADESRVELLQNIPAPIFSEAGRRVKPTVVSADDITSFDTAFGI